jgi:hypothetical protein
MMIENLKNQDYNKYIRNDENKFLKMYSNASKEFHKSFEYLQLLLEY